LHGARRERFRFLQVSTDEVFGTLADGGSFNASSRYAPNSPYAASKAAADDGKSYADGHDLRYAIDPSHAELTLGWKAQELLDSGLVKTVDWYLANAGWLFPMKDLGRLGTRRAEIVG